MQGQFPDTAFEMADATGVPEFFYTDVGKTEHAGGNCLRIYCCIQRDGQLIPQFTVVMPAMSIMVAAKRVTDAAIEVFNRGVSVLSH